MIYFDNASTTQIDYDYIEIIRQDFCKYWGNPSNLYRIGKESKNIIENSRKIIAGSLNCDPSEIYFTSGSSEGNAWALKQRKRCVCSPYEHHNILNNENSIVISDDYLETALKLRNSGGAFVGEWGNFIYSHMLVNNITGEVFDIEKLSKIAHELSVMFHCDMTQAIGNIPIDFQSKYYQDIDIATFSAHKFHGPKGIGFNYFSNRCFHNCKIEPLIYGGGQENSLRAGTENIPYIHVLGYAVEHAVRTRLDKELHCKELKIKLLEELAKTNLDYIIISPVNSINSTIAFCIKGIESELIMDALSEKEICVGVGSACNGNMKETENDSVLEAMNIPDEYIHGLIRISFDLNNKEKEVEKFVEELVNTCKDLGIIEED